MRTQGRKIYTGETNSQRKSRFWVKLLLFIIIAAALLLGLSSQNLLDQIFPPRIAKLQTIDQFDTHCLGDAPPEIYQLSGLVVTLGQSNFPMLSVPTAFPVTTGQTDTDEPVAEIPDQQINTANKTGKATPELAGQNAQNPATTALATLTTIGLPATETAAKHITNNNPWIKQQKPDHFTLQVAGGRNWAALAEIARKHLQKIPHTIYQRQLDGKAWYSLVVGSYPTLAAANRAKKNLPGGLGANKAWPKKFADIHQQIKP